VSCAGTIHGWGRRRIRHELGVNARARQLDIVGGLLLTDGAECNAVTGVDDDSRYCVIAAVVPRATGRAVRLTLLPRWSPTGCRTRGSPTMASSSPTGSVVPGVLHV
jgi:hypothetical protein